MAPSQIQFLRTITMYDYNKPIRFPILKQQQKWKTAGENKNEMNRKAQIKHIGFHREAVLAELAQALPVRVLSELCCAYIPIGCYGVARILRFLFYENLYARSAYRIEEFSFCVFDRKCEETLQFLEDFQNKIDEIPISWLGVESRGFITQAEPFSLTSFSEKEIRPWQSSKQFYFNSFPHQWYDRLQNWNVNQQGRSQKSPLPSL